MLEKGISEHALEKVQPLFRFTGTIKEKIAKLEQLLQASIEGLKGIEELRFICDAISTLGLQTAHFDLDVTLARGLNYYTGAIFEVTAPEGVAMGSIGGGGRYDDLTGILDLKYEWCRYFFWTRSNLFGSRRIKLVSKYSCYKTASAIFKFWAK